MIRQTENWFAMLYGLLLGVMIFTILYLNNRKKIRTAYACIIMSLGLAIGIVLAIKFLGLPALPGIIAGGILVLLVNYFLISNHGDKMNDFCQVKFNCKSSEETNKIISALLKARLVASADSFEIQAKYWWQGQMIDEKRIQVVTYSMYRLKKEVIAGITKLHSDEVPAIIFSDFEANDDFLNWVKTTLAGD